jgi:hypothetical protein
MLSLYRSALKDHLHPPPDHLSIESVDIPENGTLNLIKCAAHPQELKPFLVHGVTEAVRCPFKAAARVRIPLGILGRTPSQRYVGRNRIGGKHERTRLST